MRRIWVAKVSLLSSRTPRHMASVDIWMSAPPNMIFWHRILDNWCGVPSQTNCVLSLFIFSLLPFIQWLIYTYQELFNFVVSHWYVSMKVQLTVVCVGVNSKAMSTQCFSCHSSKSVERTQRTTSQQHTHVSLLEYRAKIMFGENATLCVQRVQTSSRTSILHVSVLTSSLFIRSSIRPGVATIRWTVIQPWNKGFNKSLQSSN